MTKKPPVDGWLEELHKGENAGDVGMYLVHQGVVRRTPKKKVREGIDDGKTVESILFSYDEIKVDRAIKKTRQMEGIVAVKVWLAEGELAVGDVIMQVLVGGDIRPRVIDALQFLVETIKTTCVEEVEKYR